MGNAKIKRQRDDPFQTANARALAVAAGYDPDERIEKVGGDGKTMPRWTTFIEQARAQENARKAADELARNPPQIEPQAPEYQNAPLKVFGTHEQTTIDQMRMCMSVGNVVGGVLCADGHLGYAQSVGGVVAYKGQVSISGVGFDIGCGNSAVRLDVPYDDIVSKVPMLLDDIWKTISFGVGRTNNERVEHELFDDADLWRKADMEEYHKKAEAQLGTVGSGNHYVDLMRDEDGFVWIGVHFGSRGLGHTSATKYVKAAGGTDGMNVLPTVVNEDSELGMRYIAAMQLAGRYAFAGREWVIERVRKIIGGNAMEVVHNHHNYAWKETHNGEEVWVVRKGATPAFPGQKGFVGGSMGDDAVIIEGVDSPEAKAAMYSTVHGAGRLFGRKQAKRTFTDNQMKEWCAKRGVLVRGAGLDESPMAYRRLPEVLDAHAGSIKVLRRLRPFAVAMAGDIHDPFKD